MRAMLLLVFLDFGGGDVENELQVGVQGRHVIVCGLGRVSGVSSLEYPISSRALEAEERSFWGMVILASS